MRLLPICVSGERVRNFRSNLASDYSQRQPDKIEQAEIASPSLRAELERQTTTVGHASQIVEAWRELESLIRAKLKRTEQNEVANLGAAPLLDFALDAGVLTSDQHRSLRGLNTMRNLAVHGPVSQLDEKRISEFLNLADAMKTVLEITNLP